MVWCGVWCGVIWYRILDKMVLCVVIRKTAFRVMRKREACSRVSDNLVFNIIFRYFRYDITPYSAFNGCYRRS